MEELLRQTGHEVEEPCGDTEYIFILTKATLEPAQDVSDIVSSHFLPGYSESRLRKFNIDIDVAYAAECQRLTDVIEQTKKDGKCDHDAFLEKHPTDLQAAQTILLNLVNPSRRVCVH
jgi:hypothetical protein